MNARLWTLLATLVLADITAAFETTMVFTALKELLEEYGEPTKVGWLLTAYLLVSAGSAAVCGRLGDLFGRRALLLGALGLAVLGSIISAASPSLEGVIFGRALQGVSGAVLALCLGLVREHIPASFVAISVGVVAGSAALGGALGMIVGGVLVDSIGWRYIFWASSLLAGISFLASLAFVPASKPVSSSRHLDLLGGLLFVPATTGALLAVSNGDAWQWDGRFWSLMLGSALLLGFWVRHELRHPDPLIDVRLLARRDVALPNIALALCALGAFQFSQLVLLLLQQPIWTGAGLGLTATAAALWKIPGNIASSAASPLTGFLCGRWGAEKVIVTGMTATAAACIALALAPDQILLVFVIAIVCAVGTSTVYIGVPNIIVAAAPADRISETVGVSSVLRALAMAVGAQLMIVILASSTVHDPNLGQGVFPSLGAYQLTLGLIAAASLASAAVIWWSARTKRSIPAQAEPA
ncbi:MAG: MFS transporter [Hyphomonadaceae bacterium]|nr:MFS transporter [Hyphomonadaceae bacterium]